MKTFISSLLILILIISIGCSDKPKTQISENIKNGLRKDAKEFMESLKTILVKEMQTNGVAAAVSVCSDTAQLLTVNYGFSKGIYIKRVSFMNRNRNNVPDGFETKVLKSFERLRWEKKLTDTTEFIELIDDNGVAKVRYMKPIFIQAPCLSCHGTLDRIGEDIKTILHSKYPEDKATGYDIEDLRGAVSIQKTL
jgi:uncharacterized protein (UPF0335 family)